MRSWTLLLMAAVIGFAQTPSKPADTKSEVKPAEAAVVKLPVNAVRIAEGVYKLADPDGKVWLYRRTPFGYAKSEEGIEPAAAETRAGAPDGTPFSGEAKTKDGKGAAKTSVAPVNITATEEGEKIRFERPTPFGKTQWVKHKSELNAEEARIWEAQKTKAAEPNSK